jgi:cellulose synthase/poly-beta-1,6-N-acetylglucosamine synthase-like glycosyltransferase
MTRAEWTLFAVHGLIAYAWILFPLLLLLMGRRRAPVLAAVTATGPTPQVVVILSAYNEEAHIGGQIRYLLELDYPPTRWNAYVGVDGSSDCTGSEAQAAAAGHWNVTVFQFPENRGKVAVLKDLVAQAHAATPPPEILVFTDANTAFSPDALRRLCAPFSDPSVGGVCGRLSFVTKKGSETEENVYWRLENWLKARESAIDSCLGANGAIYAIRSGLFWKPIPSNTIIDDFVVGMKIREQGYRFVYEPSAVAIEHLPPQIKDEWKRRVRIGAGDFQALRLCAACLKPSFGAFAWLFWSHKVLRWFTPHLMLAGVFLAAIASVPLRRWPGPVFLGLYAAFGMSALLGRLWSTRRGRLAQILRGVRYLLAMQAAIFVGFIRFCRGNLEGRWQRTTREQ